jgi:hypothetical protein
MRGGAKGFHPRMDNRRFAECGGAGVGEQYPYRRLPGAVHNHVVVTRLAAVHHPSACHCGNSVHDCAGNLTVYVLGQRDGLAATDSRHAQDVSRAVLHVEDLAIHDVDIADSSPY